MNIIFEIALFLVLIPSMLMIFSLIKAKKTCKSAEQSFASQMFTSIRHISRLKENIISESKELNWLDCGTRCLETRFCVGYNYKEKSKENENNCQLSHNTDYNFERVSNEDNDWTFYEAAGNRKCCVCFGPKGGVGDYCSPGCKSVNGGKVFKNAHVLLWIRSFIPPSPVWKKCSEFQMRTKSGNVETHFINPTNGIVEKGTCSRYGLPKLIDGIVDVENKEKLESIPQVQGLLSYRNDNKKLYVSNGNGWEALETEAVERNLSRRLRKEKRELLSELNKFKHEIQGLKNDFKRLEASFREKSCLEIKKNIPATTSGVYWISLSAGSPSPHIKVYCDMETHGGGWTLVYSYTFTNYNIFGSSSNAVTPRPNWSAPTANVPVSTTPPLNESSRGAVDYNLWKYIGNEVMIKSNINDWIVCQPNGGSLVTKKDGRMRCQNIKYVASKCHNPPSNIYWIGPGPTFDKYGYFFDGHTGRGWCPTHNFCDSCSKHKKGVSNPGGTIYIR